MAEVAARSQGAGRVFSDGAAHGGTQFREVQTRGDDGAGGTDGT